MKVSKSMEEIWEIKERIGKELEGKTDEEILAYFNAHEPEWARNLRVFQESSYETHRKMTTSSK